MNDQKARLTSSQLQLLTSAIIIAVIVIAACVSYISLSPVSMGGEYTKDLVHVYYKWYLIQDADPWTFEYIGGHLAKDAKYVYLYGEVFPKIDPKYSIWTVQRESVACPPFLFLPPYAVP